MTTPHQHRDVAEGFGADAERYDRTRPGYPQELIARIVAAGPGREIVDVGCGTGIAARQFKAAGCRVLGVEVDARMAELARGFPVEVAKFEDWDAGDRTFDAVVSGQTWHWIDPIAGAARAAAVLRPGGRLAVFWNVFQPEPALAEALTAVYERVMPGPNLWASDPLGSYQPILAKAGEGMREAGFAEPEQWRVDWERSYTRDEWLDQVPSFGGHNRLAPEQLAAIGEAVGDEFTMGYAAVAVMAVRP